jgi:hypothetical protein
MVTVRRFGSICWNKLVLKQQSVSRYDRRSVGQSVLVSSPIWVSWPDINYCLTLTVLSMSGAPSDERSGLSSVLVTWTASVHFSKFAAGPRQLLTRVRVCSEADWLTAKLLLALGSTVILGPSPMGLMTIFYCLTALGAFKPSICSI